MSDLEILIAAAQLAGVICIASTLVALAFAVPVIVGFYTIEIFRKRIKK